MNQKEVVNKILLINKNLNSKDLGFRADGRLEWFCKHKIGHTIYAPAFSTFSHGCCGDCKELKVLDHTNPAKVITKNEKRRKD